MLKKPVRKPVKNPPEWKGTKAAPRKRRESQDNSSGIGRWIVLAIILGVGVYFGWNALVKKVESHPIFTIRSVVVEGADYLKPEDILRTAGIEKGENIFDVNLTDVAKRLESTYAAEDFVVMRRLPDTIAIRLKERIPVALINTTELIGVDKEGVPLPHIGASLATQLPIITGVEDATSLSDSTVKSRLVEGIKLLQNISSQSPSVYKRISEVNVANISEMGITLIDNGLEVIIGDDDWANKMPILEKVINKVPVDVEAVKAIDIRFAEKVFLRKKEQDGKTVSKPVKEQE